MDKTQNTTPVQGPQIATDQAKRTSASPDIESSIISEPSSSVQATLEPIGVSGTEVFGGYFREEYLQKLRGRRGMRVFDEMRRSEPQIRMLLSAVMNPIKAANWAFEAADAVLTPDAQKHADFMTYNLFEKIDWESTLGEMLSFLTFGFSMFETIHDIVLNDPKFGNFNGLKALAWRSQKTIERWNFDRQTAELLSVDQYVYNDLGSNNTIPADFLLLLSLDKEGDNFEGISFLRSMYGAWFRKNLYLKLIAIGTEKYAVGTPIGIVPAGQVKKEDLDNFKEILKKYTSHELAYILVPAGWQITINESKFDASKIKELVVLENTEMINAALANFLALGTNGAGGAFALGESLADFFIQTLYSYAKLVTGVINRQLTPQMIKMNFGPQVAYPILKCTGIADTAGLELQKCLTGFVDSGIIRADDKLEDSIRKLYKQPAADPTTARVNPKVTIGSVDETDGIKPGAGAGVVLSEPKTGLQLAENWKKNFNDNKATLKTTMQSGLNDILDDLKAQIKTKWNTLPPSQRVTIPKLVEAKGIQTYKGLLRDDLAKIATQAIAGARAEVPKAVSKIKFSDTPWANVMQLAEKFESLKLGLSKLPAPKGGFYNALPPAMQKQIDTQADVIASTQAADLEKIVYFQFNSSASGTDDVNEVLSDIGESASATIDGSTAQGMSVDAAAANAVGSASNQARMEFFFEPDVLDTIESFTFVNEDPISEICQELAGTTWAANDPEVDKYTPPLHHNCKSRLEPNEKGDDNNPDIDIGGASVSQKALKSMTLHESCGCSSRDAYRLTQKI